MDGRIKIGDHTFDEDEGYESDQLQDDAAENRPPEPLDPMPPPPPGMTDDEDDQSDPVDALGLGLGLGM